MSIIAAYTIIGGRSWLLVWWQCRMYKVCVLSYSIILIHFTTAHDPLLHFPMQLFLPVRETVDFQQMDSWAQATKYLQKFSVTTATEGDLYGLNTAFGLFFFFTCLFLERKRARALWFTHLPNHFFFCSYPPLSSEWQWVLPWHQVSPFFSLPVFPSSDM